MLELLLLESGLIAQAAAEVGVEELPAPQARALYQIMLDVYEAGEQVTCESVLLAADDPALKSLLIELDENGRQKHERSNIGVQQRWEQTLDRFRRLARARLQRQQRASVDSSTASEADHLDELQQILEQRRSDLRR